METYNYEQCHLLLETEFNKRREKNPAYSLRAYARDLEISTTTLSDVMAKKRKFSQLNLHKILMNLELSPTQQMKVLDQETKASHLEIGEDQFKLISEWYYFAILCLCKTKFNYSEPKFISKHLGISEIQARLAIDRLKRMGLIYHNGNRIYKSTQPLSTTKDIPSSALKRHHRQLLEKAIQALWHCDLDKREITAITMPINPKKIPLAKKKIRKFLLEISDLFESEPLEKIYTLCIQFFPLSQGD